MHWIQTIREFLDLSREELAHYLQLSTHTIVSVENNRRQLPIESLLPAITLYNVIKDCNTQRPVTKPPLKTERQYLFHQKTIHSKCCRRLEKRSREFQKIQHAYTRARLRLTAYQCLAQALTAADTKCDRTRLLWVQWKIRKATQAIQDNNITTQHLLAAEIAGIESIMRVLQEN